MDWARLGGPFPRGAQLLGGPVPIKTRRDGASCIAIDPEPLYRATASIADKLVAWARIGARCIFCAKAFQYGCLFAQHPAHLIQSFCQRSRIVCPNNVNGRFCDCRMDSIRGDRGLSL